MKQFEKGDRVMITHSSREGQTGSIHGVLHPRGYLVKIDGEEDFKTGVFYLHGDLMALEVANVGGFQQNDLVQTQVERRAYNEDHMIEAGAQGLVTVVGVDLEDGSTNGIEVLFEGKCYGHYNSTELTKLEKSAASKFAEGDSVIIVSNRVPELHKCAGWIGMILDEGYIVATARNGIHQDTVYLENELEAYDYSKNSPELEVDMKVRVVNPEHVLYGKTGIVREIKAASDSFAPIKVEFIDQEHTTHFRHAELEIVAPQAAVKREDRPEMLEIDGFNPQAKAIALVKTMFYSEPGHELGENDIYVVWFCKTLQNWKAMISTNAKDNAYYEVTYDGDKKRAYVDAYHKHVNVVAHDSGMCDMTVMDNFLQF